MLNQKKHRPYLRVCSSYHEYEACPLPQSFHVFSLALFLTVHVLFHLALMTVFFLVRQCLTKLHHSLGTHLSLPQEYKVPVFFS